jgi:nucleotide-binding universal stress UspA family protein
MKILLAIDGSECSLAAVEAVTSEFRREDTEVHVFHADEWPKGLPTSLAFAEGPAAAASILELHEKREREARALVAHTVQQLQAAGFRSAGFVRTGDARHEIVAYASEWRADLIVLGSHGRRGVDRFLLGSVSDGVVHHAPCSVQIVRGGGQDDMPIAI